MLVAWRERVQPDGESVEEDSTEQADRRFLTLEPVSR